MHLAEAALLCKWCVLEVLRFYAQIRGDVVADHFEPFHLFRRESWPPAFAGVTGLGREPRLEVGVDTLGKRDELVVLVDGEAHERYEIGEDAPPAGTLDPGFLQRGVGVPELGFGPQVGRLLDGVGEVLDGLECKALLVGLAVEDLQRGDLVLVLLDELLEGLDHAFGAVQRIPGEGALQHLVGADGVDNNLVLLLDLVDGLAQFRVVERLHGILDDLVPGGVQRPLRDRAVVIGGAVEVGPGLFDVPVGIQGLDDAVAEFLNAGAAGELADLFVILGLHAVPHARKPPGERREHLVLGVAEGHGLHELLEADGGLLLHGAGVGLVLLADADGIDDDEVVLGRGVGRDALQVVGLDDTHPAALHLLEEGARLDRAHEHHDLHRLDVGAGGDHVHRHRDPGHGAGAELVDEIFRFRAGRAVGDLLGEVVALAELLAHDLDDVLGVGVVLGKDQGLGHPLAAGEDLGEELVTVGLDDLADLVRGDDVAVELVGVVAEVVVELFPTFLARVAFLDLHRVAGLHLRAPLGDGGADAVDVVVDVDAVGHGHLVVVFHHQVLVEETEGLLAGRGGEADQVGVEVLQHLRPEVIDGAVAFVGDDDVEGLDGDGRVVFDRLRFPDELAQLIAGFLFQILGQLPALQHRVQPLDGADADPRGGVEGVAGQALDDVFLGELEIVVGRDILLEFLQGLVAEVAAVDQEQDPPGAGELDQPVEEIDRRVSLAGPCGHLDERARAVVPERLFQVVDGLDLGGPQALLVERRHVLQAGEKGIALVEVLGHRPLALPILPALQPLGQQLGPVEGEDRTRARLRVEAVGEARLHAGRLVGEWQRPAPGRQGLRQALRVPGRLDLHPAQGGPGLLGLDDARRLPVHVEQVVREAVAGFQRKLADRHAPVRRDVGLVGVTDHPPRLAQQPVDLLARLLLGGGHALGCFSEGL